MILLDDTDQNSKHQFREEEAADYGNLGAVFQSLGHYDKAKEYFQKALVIGTEIGDRNGEASCYENLAAVFHSLEQYNNAKEYLQKRLSSELRLATEKEKELITET